MEIRKYFEINRNEDRAYQNLEGPTKAVLRGKYIAINYMKKKHLQSITYTSTISQRRKRSKLNQKQTKGRQK